MSAARSAAIAVLEALVESRSRSERIQAAMREEWPDIAGMSLSAKIEGPVVALIDAVLGEKDGFGLASYLLFGGGGTITVNGRVYPIRTVDDLRVYLEREVPEFP